MQWASIYLSTVWYITSFGIIPQKDGNGRRASTSPYANTPSLLVQSFCFYQYFFHTCTPLPYPSKWPSSSTRTLDFTHTLFFPSSLLFILSIWPNHLKTFFSHSTIPYFTPFAQVPISSMQTFIASTLILWKFMMSTYPKYIKCKAVKQNQVYRKLCFLYQ